MVTTPAANSVHLTVIINFISCQQKLLFYHLRVKSMVKHSFQLWKTAKIITKWAKMCLNIPSGILHLQNLFLIKRCSHGTNMNIYSKEHAFCHSSKAILAKKYAVDDF